MFPHQAKGRSFHVEDQMKYFNDKIKLTLNTDAEISVNGCIAPIAYTQYNFHEDWDTLANLRVSQPEKLYPTSVFRDFLPSKSVSVGELWKIQQAGVLELLKQLHPAPHLDMRGLQESQGYWACLRAYNDKFAHILFRIHAEFKLKDGWFTPSQFAGQLGVDRTQGKVLFFQIHVPPNTLNFDVHWESTDVPDPYTHVTDIGYCPQMELYAGTHDILQNTEFTDAITQAEAAHKLARCFYESQRINWVPLHQALEIAKAHQKPIHAITVDGPLADESC